MGVEGLEKGMGGNNIGRDYLPQIWWGNKGDMKERGRSSVHFLIFVFEIKENQDHG